ncbi:MULTISPECIES: phosphate/phosphite/phosphonate ABC transporter substrate-binding protein [unclassified Halomonas]|jgi:phosphonate transport system substrate-binding protein|uniref:phosphate/phosphite/phosphonate ABC transporter substrate-binding protein n=1 Tax=unclassified Halomonas TaxID=2609666 RepID=UPI000289CF02|nr:MULTISPECIES: phosphate/phosphite/phosphonate ABC transporter substrate-binding protein [unclassified Halomonas]MCE8040272.1 phosphate/phosphite/phosphonate ABC transporter substrate-binding protein [Halomonas sp. MCCC 1A11062]
MFKLVLPFAALGLMAAATQAQAAESCPATLRFADTGIEGTEELQRAFSDFVEEVESRLSVNVEFFPVGNRTTAINALRFEQVDIVLAGPSEYVLMAERVDGVQPITAIVRPEYYSVFIAASDSGIESLEDLRGKHVAMKDHGSTTGHIMPSYMLHKAGLDIDRDLQISLLDGARMQALASGEVDAVGTGVRDFAPFASRHGEDSYRIIERGQDMPGDPIVAGPHISADCVSEIREAFMADPEGLLQAILSPGERDKYIGAEMVRVNDAEYDVVRESYALLGLND